MKITNEDLTLAANTVRCLSADGVQKAKSGHPGMPMGMADVATNLYLKHLAHNPSDPNWFNRDRFVLSAGHGAMLAYSMLHLSGYDLSIEDLQNFRQWDSKTPGHPEYGHTEGIETTTGPLGQGISTAVGIALAERMMADRFNMDGMDIVDHYTYVICGDGDLMEGISHEACSLAGHLGLNKLIVFYDSNSITIEGRTELALSDDAKKRFQAYNWNVIEIDGHDFDQIEKATRKAKREKARPTMVICTSKIGKGSPNKADTSSAHGEPLGEDEVKATKKNLGFPEDEFFVVPDKVRELFESRQRTLKRQANKWKKLLKAYGEANPEKLTQMETHIAQHLPESTEALLPEFPVDTAVATRSASGKVIQELSKAFSWLVGGSADLAPSTKTLIDAADSIKPGAFCGSNLHFGVREHAMGAIINGMTLHGGFRVFGATFFVFSDYCRPAIRMAAIMKLPVIYVFTHDSFYVGEDGPTHEPVEHIASLRCMPGVTVIRPADPTETGAAWIAALKNTDGPTAMLFTRQNLKVIDRSKFPAADNLEKGAYTLCQSGEGTPDVVLVASGSEVELALEAAETLAGECNVRVVSMPSWELFELQDDAYRKEVIPPAAKVRMAIEAGASMGWSKYIGEDGLTLCMDHFGASAPYKVLAEKFGYTPENVVSIVKTKLNG
jgi:transketolase